MTRLRLLAPLTGLAVFAGLWWSFPAKLHLWDEFQLSYAVRAFDLARHEPHPPGYYLFVLAGRALAPLLGDPALALRCVAAACVAGFAMLAVGPARPGEPALARGLRALAVAGFALLSPLLGHFGAAALTYTAEGLLWCLLLLALAREPRGRWLPALAFAAGLAGGVRPTLALWGAAALLARGWAARPVVAPRRAAAAAALFAAGLSCWMLPLLVESGGLAGWRAASADLLSANVWGKSVFVRGPAVLGARLAAMLGDLLRGLGALAPVAAALLLARRRGRAGLARLDPLLLGALLAFAFYALLLYDSAGYGLAFVMPLALWSFRGAGAWLAGRPPRQQVAASAALAAAVCGAPFAPGLGLRPEERYDLHDARIEARLAPLRERFDPRATVLVTSLEYRDYGLRHVAHELPGFTTLQLARDPWFAITSAERPYLAARERRLEAVGPEDLDLADLLGGGRLAAVVYVVPFDAERFVDASCAPLASELPVGAGESLRVLRPGPGWRIHAWRGRLFCAQGPTPAVSPAPGPAGGSR